MKLVWISFLMFCANGQTGSTGQPPAVPSNGQTENNNVKPEDKCSVEGKVLNALTGEPLKKAHVTLWRADATGAMASPYGATTDAAGRFKIEKLDPGRYRPSADRTGYVRSDTGPKKLTNVPDTLTLAAGQKLGDLQFKMMPQSVITGRVLDEENEPLANVRLQCMRYRWANGKKALMAMGGTSTNDKGEYRAFGLPAGKYYVSASYMQNRGGPAEIRADTAPEDGYVQTYYPNAMEPASAIQVDLAAGTETSGIDIRLVRAKTFQVSGTVINRSKTSNPVEVMLTKHDAVGSTWDNMKRVTSDAKGNFVLRGLMPGSYDIQAVEYNSEQQRFAMQQLTVGDESIDGLRLALGTAPEVQGVLSIESASQQSEQKVSDTAMSSRIGLYPEANTPLFGMAGGGIKEDGTFTLKNVTPQKYRLMLFPMQEDAYVKRVVVGDKVFSDGRVDFSQGVEGGQITIVVSMNGARVEGAVLDSKQQSSAHATVVLVPDHSDATQRYKSGTTDQNGHYVLRGVAPGKYKLYAFEQIEAGAFYDADYMRPFASKGETVEVSEGLQLTHDLKLIVDEGGQ